MCKLLLPWQSVCIRNCIYSLRPRGIIQHITAEVNCFFHNTFWKYSIFVSSPIIQTYPLHSLCVFYSVCLSYISLPQIPAWKHTPALVCYLNCVFWDTDEWVCKSSIFGMTHKTITFSRFSFFIFVEYGLFFPLSDCLHSYMYYIL